MSTALWRNLLATSQLPCSISERQIKKYTIPGDSKVFERTTGLVLWRFRPGPKVPQVSDSD
ncbi:hypothetical protein POX_d04817 [Penicillium oxalicum]|uniref:Uncharacterized protein n=1 Tax=Penicillium oxalicum (strain 114-2 / CGMCC 5302) TaxID=933388 RepID=S7ZW93_PENO1|nr:hypothetical protein POX_d04817 [Penicillium oxalicum]EPS33036.1 hypothetical protein PDE_07997 [Penicillium oxalicum 114-2]KAI2789330.1 hypothetical protein POX_d04817 [Penicillium oxalicum]